MNDIILVGGLEHDWEGHNPNWRTHIFQRGRSTTNQYNRYTLWLFNVASGKWPIEIDGLPIRNGWIFYSYVSHNQRVMPDTKFPWVLLGYAGLRLQHEKDHFATLAVDAVLRLGGKLGEPSDGDGRCLGRPTPPLGEFIGLFV